MGQESFEDYSRPGRQWSDNILTLVKKLVLSEGQVKVKEMIKISFNTVRRILHGCAESKYKWAPKYLLELYEAGPNPVLKNIGTSDEGRTLPSPYNFYSVSQQKKRWHNGTNSSRLDQ